jgi:hypothetical protein
MRKPNFALELFLLICLIGPLAIISPIYWFTTGKIPPVLFHWMFTILVGCVIAGIEERFRSNRKKSMNDAC